MDFLPFKSGRAGSYTSVFPSGPGQQSTCMPDLTETGAICSPYPFDPGHLIYPHDLDLFGLPSAQLLERTRSLLAEAQPSDVAYTAADDIFPIKTEQSWPTPPLEADDCESFLGKSSPTLDDIPLCKLSPTSQASWPSPTLGCHQTTNPDDLQQPDHLVYQPLYASPAEREHTTCSVTVFPPYIAKTKEELDTIATMPFFQPSPPAMLYDYPSTTLCPSPLTPADTMTSLSGFLDLPQESRSMLHSPPLLNGCSGDNPRPGNMVSHFVHGRREGPYAKLIYDALMSRPTHAMTLQEIYQWFRENTAKTSTISKGWQNSIRHNLSMNAAFKNRDPAGLETSKRSAEWVLESWAILGGVQSTTRYRKGSHARRNLGMRSMNRTARRYPRSSRITHMGSWEPIYNPIITMAPALHDHVSQTQPYLSCQLPLPTTFSPMGFPAPQVKREVNSTPPTPELVVSESLDLLLPSCTLPAQPDGFNLRSTVRSGSDDAPRGRGEFPYTLDDVQLPYTIKCDEEENEPAPLFVPLDGLNGWGENFA